MAPGARRPRRGAGTTNAHGIGDEMTDQYIIRVIAEPDCRTLGEAVGSANTAAEAVALADSLGPDYHYGVAIVDKIASTVSLGDEIIPAYEVRYAR
jgi:hypothetical protein